jgi:heptosyltransferase-2
MEIDFGKEMSFDRILIIQTAFPGDLILTTPLIRATKEKYPQARLTLLVIPETQDLLKNNPYVSEVLNYDKRSRPVSQFFAVLKEVKKRNFDLALTPHRSFRSALLAYGGGCRRRVGFDTSAGRFLLTDRIKYRLDWHEIERNLSLLHPDGAKPQGICPELYPGTWEIEKVVSFLQKHNAKLEDDLVCLAPGSVWATKRWLPQRFAQVADWLMKQQVKTVLIGSEEDSSLAEEICSNMSAKPINACGKLSLLESAALISTSRLVISHDSAPTHMAVAMSIPVITIFGSTVPEFGFYPYGEGNVIVQKQLYCRPCGIHGRKKCPERHFRCMNDITAEEVFEAVQGRLNEKRVQAH